MVANSASVDEYGLLHIERGGWEHTSPQALPCTLNIGIAGIAEIEGTEVGTSQIIRLTIRDLVGSDPWLSASVLVNARREPPVPGVQMQVPFAVRVSLPVLEPSVVRVSASYGGTELASCAFQVRGDVTDTAPRG
jgi:hypothetical protein